MGRWVAKRFDRWRSEKYMSKFKLCRMNEFRPSHILRYPLSHAAHRFVRCALKARGSVQQRVPFLPPWALLHMNERVSRFAEILEPFPQLSLILQRMTRQNLEKSVKLL